VQTSWRCRTSLTGAGKDHAAARIGRVWAEPRGERPLQGGEWRSADLGLIAQRLKQGSTQGGGCLEIFVVCGCGWVGRRWIGTETLVVVFIYLHTGSTCQLFTGFTSRAGTSTKILYPLGSTTKTHTHTHGHEVAPVSSPYWVFTHRDTSNLCPLPSLRLTRVIVNNQTTFNSRASVTHDTPKEYMWVRWIIIVIQT